MVSDKPNVYNNLGLALIRQGKINQAVFQFKQALKIDPQNTVGHRNLKRVMAFQEKLDKAAENLEKALDLNSGTLDDGRLDQIIKKRNELNEVVEQLKNALTTQPGFNPEEFDIKNLSNVYQIYDKYNRLIP